MQHKKTFLCQGAEADACMDLGLATRAAEVGDVVCLSAWIEGSRYSTELWGMAAGARGLLDNATVTGGCMVSLRKTGIGKLAR
jgi:hypothetical protein